MSTTPKLTPSAELAVTREKLADAQRLAERWAETADAKLKSVDPEALALSHCIKALDSLVLSSSFSSYGLNVSNAPSSKGYAAIARVIAHLSSRYQVGAS